MVFYVAADENLCMPYKDVHDWPIIRSDYTLVFFMVTFGQHNYDLIHEYVVAILCMVQVF
jgi:hypothetical protein